jgi:hypothetical protein
LLSPLTTLKILPSVTLTAAFLQRLSKKSPLIACTHALVNWWLLRG